MYDWPFIWRLAAARNDITTIKRINEKNHSIEKLQVINVETFSSRTEKVKYRHECWKEHRINVRADESWLS